MARSQTAQRDNCDPRFTTGNRTLAKPKGWPEGHEARARGSKPRDNHNKPLPALRGTKSRQPAALRSGR